jgi:adenosylcobinamide kinase/adenosylcobinamide-phosphate guanylyltransferase
MASQRTRRLILLLGGARSGKSDYAQSLAAQIAGARPVVFVATATASDEEMADRIARHRTGRPAHWLTVEAPLDPAGALAQTPEAATAPAIVVDCVTLLVSNLLLDEVGDGDLDPAHLAAIEARALAALDALLSVPFAPEATLIVVSNEVGMGLVPEYPLGRAFRDMLGRANARLASEADRVLLLIAGLPVELTALASAWQQRASEIFSDRD